MSAGGAHAWQPHGNFGPDAAGTGVVGCWAEQAALANMSATAVSKQTFDFILNDLGRVAAKFRGQLDG